MARKKCHDAWQAWWDKHGVRLDLGAPLRGHRRPGLVLAHEQNHGQPAYDAEDKTLRGEGTLWVCGCDGRSRWRLAGFEHVEYARWLPGGRLLLAEVRYSAGRGAGMPAPAVRVGKDGGVPERDLEGKVLWKYEGVPYPRYCARLGNGNTVVASIRLVAEVTPLGKQVESWNGLLLSMDFDLGFQEPRRLATGDYLAIAEGRPDQWHLAVVDRTNNRVRWHTSLENVGDGERRVTIHRPATRIEALPNGHYQVEGWGDNITREFDVEGKVVWQSPPKWGFNSAYPLPNGNTLGAARGWYRVVELSPGGRVQWEAFGSGHHLWRAWPILNLVRLGFYTPRPRGFNLDTSVDYRIKGLTSKRAWVRCCNTVLIRPLGTKAEAAVPALLEMHVNPVNRNVNGQASDTLTEVSTIASLPLFPKATKDRRPEIREAACSALWKYSAQGREVVPVLLRCLSDENVLVRRAAAGTLGAFKTEAEIVVPALVKALEDKDRTTNGHHVATSAASSLTRFPEKAGAIVPALIKATKAEDQWVRRYALHVLPRFRSMSSTIEPVLKQALLDEDPQIRRQAAASLEQLRH